MPHPRTYRLAFITPYYWPQIAACTLLYGSLASHLGKEGAEVVVFTNDVEEPGKPQPFPGEGYHPPALRRVANPFLRRKGVLSKALEYLWFTLFVMWSLVTEDRFEVLFLGSNPPLIAVPIGLIARIKRCRVVYNLQDLFPESAFSAGLLDRHGRAGRVLRFLERANYRLSHRTIAICEPFGTHVRQVLPSAAVDVIPNWVDADFMTDTGRERNAILAAHGLLGKFVILYAGNMGYSHDLEVVIEAAALLASHTEVHFLFVGEGNRKDAAIQHAARLGLDNCTFMGFMPYSELPQVYSGCDLGIVTMRTGSEATAVPSKTWNYLSCRRPVICSVDTPSELASAMAASGAGVVIPAGQPQALAAGIAGLLADPGRRAAMAQAGRRYIEQELAERIILERYAQALVRALN